MKKSDLPEWLSKSSYRIIEHMNEDHLNTIKAALNAVHGIKDQNAFMFALSSDGYYVKSNKNIFFIGFDRPAFKAKDYRNTLIDLAKKYRSFEI